MSRSYRKTIVAWFALCLLFRPVMAAEPNTPIRVEEYQSVIRFGVSGSTLLNRGNLPYQKQRAFKAALDYDPQVVVVMLGTNDTKPQNWKFKNEFAADYKELLGQFAKLPAKPRIFICRPVPVPGSGNYGINEAGVKEQAPMIDKIAREMQVGKEL